MRPRVEGIPVIFGWVSSTSSPGRFSLLVWEGPPIPEGKSALGRGWGVIGVCREGY